MILLGFYFIYQKFVKNNYPKILATLSAAFILISSV
nr:MAG TPA: hypothetical protein [Caudoviricetes sp.]